MKYIAFTVCFLVSQSAFGAQSEPAAPFGLTMGTRTEQFRISRQLLPFWFNLRSVPQPDASYKSYVATITPRAGLCFIGASTKNISIKSNNNELRSTFMGLKAQVDSVYGESKLIDTLRPAGIVAVNEKLSATWLAKNGSIMKPTLQMIHLEVMSAERKNASIMIAYYFDNYDQCSEEANDAEKSQGRP
jgi:hypothetical protein